MPNTDRDESLRALLNKLTASNQSAKSALDRTIARLDEAERRRPELDAAARARALAEFAGLDAEVLADLYASGVRMLSP
jgi:hypothetical protein